MKHHVFSAFSEKPFLLLWLGELCTQFSINLFTFFLVLVIFKLTKSNTAVSIIVLTFTLPSVFLGVLAGAYVDRWNKKMVLLSTNIIRAILLIFLALLYKNIFMIYLVSLLISITTQFFIPAETPVIPLLVKKENLFSANALFGIGLFGSILVAYIFSGPLLLFAGEMRTLFVLSVLFMCSALFISLISVPQVIGEAIGKERKPLHISIMREIRETLGVVFKEREISSSLFLLALSQILILLFAVVLPGFATSILHIRIVDIPLLLVTPAACGVVVGAVILGNFFHNISKEKLITTGLFLSGLAMCGLPFSAFIVSKDFVRDINSFMPAVLDITRLHMLIFISFILGLANALVFVPSNTILQEKTTDESRGKVYGVLNTVIGVFSLVPIILTGSLSDILGVGQVITGIGVVLIFLGIGKVTRRF